MKLYMPLYTAFIYGKIYSYIILCRVNEIYPILCIRGFNFNFLCNFFSFNLYYVYV